ncbi:MAG: hypothetical protein RLZZ324_453 [Candidatus Parcubacteria bacterium]|jgi:hypothetical protein
MEFGHKRDKRAMIFRTAVLVVLVITAAAIALVRMEDKKAGPDLRIPLAQCLTEKGVKMYGAYWCPHCQQQKKDFGKEAFDKITYVECAIPGDPQSQTPACKDAGVTSYPTWVFPSGDRPTGEQPLKDLADKAGCPYAAK